jgi:protein ImuB
MTNRFVAITFSHLIPEWVVRRKPELSEKPFALVFTERGRRVVKAVNSLAEEKGARNEMAITDCRALVPDLEVLDFEPDRPNSVLSALAEWCIRFTPVVSVDLPDGLLLDATGCTHLWESEANYLDDISRRLFQFGYTTRIAAAGTIGAAWAVARFGKNLTIVESGTEAMAIAALPPASLRLEPVLLNRLAKLGLHTVSSFIHMPRTALRRRFGQSLLLRLDHATGHVIEFIKPIAPVTPYQERLPSLEPIRTAKGIEIGIRTLLESLNTRLERECKGLRKCTLKCYRLDGTLQQTGIETSRPSRNVKHLFRLFENRIAQINPGLGIELFVLEATLVEELQAGQDALWSVSNGNEAAIAELVDRLAGRTGWTSVCRYLPAEHYWPERSVKATFSLSEKPETEWRTDLPRPLHLLKKPEKIEVTVPLPDYPPMLFWYKGTLHTVKKADGPERIEQEWWLQSGVYRDYYCVEDESGARYWLFRAGDYDSGEPEWYVHGFFS